MAMSDRLVVMHAGRIAQVGPPEEVYRRPRTEFVARFLGECNLIPTTVTSRTRAKVTAENALFGTFSVPEERVAPTLAASDTCLATLRPEDLLVHPTGGGDRAGQVSERSYLGARSRYVIASGELHLVAIANGGVAAADGSQVGLSWDLENVCLVAPDPSIPPPLEHA